MTGRRRPFPGADYLTPDEYEQGSAGDLSVIDVAAQRKQAGRIPNPRVAEIVAAMNAYDAEHSLPNEWDRFAEQFPEYDPATERLPDCDRFLLTDGTEIVWDQDVPQWQAERPEEAR